jgi:hypothetical protein
MTDDEFEYLVKYFEDKAYKSFVEVYVLMAIQIESLEEEIKRLKSVNKVGPAKTKDKDEALRIFAVETLATLERKEPGCIPTEAEWYKIVGDPNVKWQSVSLKNKKEKGDVGDDLELLPNGLGKARAKGWYYDFQKRVKNTAAWQALFLDRTEVPDEPSVV